MLRMLRMCNMCKYVCVHESTAIPESKMITVSAVERLIPNPPARVDSRKQKSGESFSLKCSIACLDGLVCVFPC